MRGKCLKTLVRTTGVLRDTLLASVCSLITQSGTRNAMNSYSDPRRQGAAKDENARERNLVMVFGG